MVRSADRVIQLVPLPLTELADRRQADELLAMTISDRQLRRFLLQNLVQDDGVYRWRINLAALKNSLADLGNFPAFTAAHPGPVLFLGSSDSDYLHPRHLRAINRHFSNAEILNIKNAGHWLHVDQPEVVLDRIIRFLH